MQVSAQLYTVRTCGDLAAQLGVAAESGYRCVETTGLHDLSVSEMSAIVKRSGLRVTSAHFDWEEFETRFSDIVELLGLLECQVAVMPWLTPEARPDTAAGWMAVSGQLSEWAARLGAHGLKLAYHNHDFDLIGCPDRTPLELILAQGNIYWQPDIGWIIAAGLDPVEMIERYASQILSIHAKDVDPTQTGDARWRDLGEGVVQWQEMLRALRGTNCTDLFVEHDEPSDPRSTLQIGHRYLTRQLSRPA